VKKAGWGGMMMLGNNSKFLIDLNGYFRTDTVVMALNYVDDRYYEQLIYEAIRHKSTGEFVHVNNLDEVTEFSKHMIIEDQKSSKNAAEIASLKHQEDVIEGVNSKIRKKLNEVGFDLNSYIGGVVDSDQGKRDVYRELLTVESAKSDLLLDVLRGQGPLISRKAMAMLLKKMGFKGKHLLNPNHTNEELRKIFNDYPVLQIYLHELPGISDAILLLEKGIISEINFIKRLQANLFHNGPDQGFWGERLSRKLVPDALGENANDIEARNFFKETVFEGPRVNGVVTPKYPAPTSLEGFVHTLFDRMSQATKGGVKKIYLELQDYSDLNKIALMQDLIQVSSLNTLKQLDALKKVARKKLKMHYKKMAVIENLIEVGQKRLKTFRENTNKTIGFTIDGDGEFNKINLIYKTDAGLGVLDEFIIDSEGIRRVTIYSSSPIMYYTKSFTNPDCNENGDGFADQLNHAVSLVLEQEEEIFGDAVRDL